MSITAETAKAHAKEPAVLCCRAEGGTVIQASNLEDPSIFDDLVDSNLLDLTGALTIGQVIGATLKKTADALTLLTAELVEGAAALEDKTAETKTEKTNAAENDTADIPSAALEEKTQIAGGTLRIQIGEGKNINIELPLGVLSAAAGKTSGAFSSVSSASPSFKETSAAEDTDGSAPSGTVSAEEKTVRSLKRKHYRITEVKRGPETRIEGTVLYIREGIEQEAADSQELVHSLKLDVVTPENYHTYSDTIMDIQPIAAKEGDAELGSGVTRVLDGIVVMVTGTDENGVQVGEFGSSEGYIDENVMWGRPGAPDKGDILLRTKAVIKAGTNMERPGPLAVHTATDMITQEIREALKKLDDESLVVSEEMFEQVRRPGRKKVVIVKEIMGQGAMHDNLILPVEPVGVLGAKPNVDIGNVPVMTSPLEVLDGCIHALTCIGPASKEMSRHYWREPLVLEALNDKELDLCGVLFVGSPQINSEKFYVSKRVGMTVEALDCDGAFVTTEGFGNNHIDFASHIEQIGMRGVPVIGMSFCAVQGALVVGNQYMKYMIDNNKSESGIENEVLACNTLCPEDAVRAVDMLKAVMAGEEIKPAEKKWNPQVKSQNLSLIGGETGQPVETEKNEQSLPMSQKRKEKYD